MFNSTILTQSQEAFTGVVLCSLQHRKPNALSSRELRHISLSTVLRTKAAVVRVNVRTPHQ